MGTFSLLELKCVRPFNKVFAYVQSNCSNLAEKQSN